MKRGLEADILERTELPLIPEVWALIFGHLPFANAVALARACYALNEIHETAPSRKLRKRDTKCAFAVLAAKQDVHVLTSEDLHAFILPRTFARNPPSHDMKVDMGIIIYKLVRYGRSNLLTPYFTSCIETFPECARDFARGAIRGGHVALVEKILPIMDRMLNNDAAWPDGHYRPDRRSYFMRAIGHVAIRARNEQIFKLLSTPTGRDYNDTWLYWHDWEEEDYDELYAWGSYSCWKHAIKMIPSDNSDEWGYAFGVFTTQRVPFRRKFYKAVLARHYF